MWTGVKRCDGLFSNCAIDKSFWSEIISKVLWSLWNYFFQRKPNLKGCIVYYKIAHCYCDPGNFNLFMDLNFISVPFSSVLLLINVTGSLLIIEDRLGHRLDKINLIITASLWASGYMWHVFVIKTLFCVPAVFSFKDIIFLLMCNRFFYRVSCYLYGKLSAPLYLV